MSYTSLDSCLKAIDNQTLTTQMALERDNWTGWHLVALEALKVKPTPKEICAEINLLAEGADEVVQKVERLFQGEIKGLVDKEREAYKQALFLVGKESLPHQIANFGIVNQSLLLDLALRASESDFHEVAKHFANFGIADEDKRFEFALKFAHLYWRDYFPNLKITDPQKLLHLALKSGGAGDEIIADLVKRFPGEPDKVMLESLQYKGYKFIIGNLFHFTMLKEETKVEIALDFAKKGLKSDIIEHLADLGIKEEENIFKIAMEAPSSDFLKYLKNKEHLFQLALKCAKESDFEEYKITDCEKILQVVLARKNYTVSAAIIELFHKDPYQALLKVAEIAPTFLPSIVHHFGIKEEEKRLQLALIAMKRGYQEVLQKLPNFQLSEESCYQIALKCAVDYHGLYLSGYFNGFAISDPLKIIRIGLKTEKVSDERIVDFQKRYSQEPLKVLMELTQIIPDFIAQKLSTLVEERVQRLKVALKVVERNANAFDHCLEGCGFDEEERFRLALKIAEVDPYFLYQMMDTFQLSPKKIYQVVLKAALKNRNIAHHLKQFNFSEEERYQVLMKIADADPFATITTFDKFEITDPDRRFQMAAFFAEKEGGRVVEYIGKFGVTDQLRLLQLALTILINQPSLIEKVQSRFGLGPELEQKLSKVAEAQFNSTEDEGAFQSLVELLRPEGIPLFLQERSKDPLILANHRRWAVQFLNSFVTIPNQKIEEERALFTQMKELRNPALRLEITKLLPSLISSSKGGKELAPLLLLDVDAALAERICAKQYDPESLVFFLCKIKPFSREDRAALLEKLAQGDMAKEMAGYEKGLELAEKEIISSKISELGIQNQALLLDIAIKASKVHLLKNLDNFGLFGLTEENRFKFALEYAERVTPEIFNNLKITDPEKVLHFALKKGKASDTMIEEQLALFAEDPGKAVLTALQYDHEIICSHMPCFKQLDEETRVQIALHAAAKGYKQLAAEIAFFGIAKEENRLKVALKALEMPKYFKNFDIREEKYRYEAALHVVEKRESEFFEYLDNFGITDPKMLLALLLKDDSILEIKDLYLALLKAAVIAPKYIPKIVRYFAIKEEKDRFQLALKLVDSHPLDLVKDLPNFELNEESRYQIGLKVSEYTLEHYWEQLAIADPLKIVRLLGASEKRFETDTTSVLLELAERHPAILMKSLPSFQIKDRMQIALKIAKINPNAAIKGIQSSGLAEEERYQVALTAMATDPFLLSCTIKIFALSEKRRTDLFLKAYQKAPETVAYLSNYEIGDKTVLSSIAFDLAERNGLLLAQNFSKFGIQDLRLALTAAALQPGHKIGEQMGFAPEIETMLKRVEAMQTSGKEASTEEAEAFRALVKKVRPEQLPPFILEPNPDPIAMMNLRKWIVKILPIPNEKIVQGKEVFTQLMQMRNPALRLDITSHLLKADMDKLEPLKDLRALKRNDLSWIARLLLTDYDTTVAKGVYNAFYAKLDDPFKQELFLLFLQRIKQLPMEDQAALLQQFKPAPEFMRTVIDLLLYGHPELLTSEGMRNSSPAGQLEKLFQQELNGLNVQGFEKRYAETLSSFRKKEVIFTYLAHLKTLGDDKVAAFKVILENIFNGTFYDKRYDIPHLKAVFGKFPDLQAKWRKGETGVTEQQLLTEKIAWKGEIAISPDEIYNNIIRDKHLTDNPEKLYPDLCAALKTPEKIDTTVEKLIKEIPEAKGEGQQRKGIEVRALRLLQTNLTQDNKRKYLNELANYCKGTQFANDIDGWLRLMQPVVSRSDYQVSDTDHPNHLLLLGEEVEGSCQKITGGADYNQGLLGYMLNGYNRAIVVTDKSGTIAARSLLRLYWDGERPVLYQERFYTRSNDPKLKELVRAMCLRRAKELNLPLVSAEQNENTYPKTLRMQGGNTDFEYVDAIGGIRPSNHQVEKSYLLWEPTE